MNDLPLEYQLALANFESQVDRASADQARQLAKAVYRQLKLTEYTVAQMAKAGSIRAPEYFPRSEL